MIVEDEYSLMTTVLFPVHVTDQNDTKYKGTSKSYHESRSHHTAAMSFVLTSQASGLLNVALLAMNMRLRLENTGDSLRE